MKKYLSIMIIVALCFSVLSGCSGTSGVMKNTLTAEDQEIITQLRTAVQESEEALSDVTMLAQEQMEQSEIFSGEYAAATEKNEIYDSGLYEQLVRTNQAQVEKYLNSVRSIAQRTMRLSISGDAGIRGVQDATAEYFARLESGLTDMNAVMRFYIDECDASAPVTDFDSTAYGNDQFALMQGLYDAIYATINKLDGVTSCPAYMKETFEAYKQKVAVYAKMIESMYEGQARGDVLKVYSANQLFARQQIIVLKYEMTLFKLFDLQYQKVLQRFDGDISTLRSELLTACNSLLSSDASADGISFAYKTREADIELEYEAVDTIYPNLYPAIDAVINLTATAEGGECEVMVEAEIVGFTQRYRQKITLNEQVTRLLIKPVLLTDMPDLSQGKDAMLSITVTNEDSGKVIVQESKTVKLMSVYDYLLWDDEFGAMTDDNILAWLTPESEGVLALRRKAISILPELTDGQMDTLAGYQNVVGADEENLLVNTYMQILGLQAAISEMGVRYNWGAFSLGSSLNQRVLLPDDILDNKSGICIETSILLASAIQSAGMHPMIVFTPGHAQVAVETWRNSGQYFLVETTTLPFNWRTDDFSSVAKVLSSEDWASYIQAAVEGGCGYIVDCDLVNILGIQGIGY